MEEYRITDSAGNIRIGNLYHNLGSSIFDGDSQGFWTVTGSVCQLFAIFRGHSDSDCSGDSTNTAWISSQWNSGVKNPAKLVLFYYHDSFADRYRDSAYSKIQKLNDMLFSKSSDFETWLIIALINIYMINN